MNSMAVGIAPLERTRDTRGDRLLGVLKRTSRSTLALAKAAVSR